MPESPESGDDFDIVDQYDSIEDPWLRSEFLDAIGTTGTTLPRIDALRRRRDAARRAAKSTPPQDGPTASARAGEARRRIPRTRRRPRVVVPRPPNKGQGRRRYPSARPRVVLVIILELD
ncbi:hypothetical protein [Streptomyces sp. NPDC002215]|uniref:hypothetical protein n=1 Tax=Streptomyces sp. NPDC002215 TaxID=3154412 RepID=UPI00331B5F7E